MSAPLSDAGARQRITQDTDHTLFVEAGAGSGKTSSLIGRITHLVLIEGVALRGIAAVTFTEKAGAELRDRLRASVESASGLEGTAPAVALAASNDGGGSAKGPVDVDLPPWTKGRDGTAVGRAVHAVLQSVDLASGADVAAAVAAQCVAEGVERHSAVVTWLVRSALASPTVQRAVARRHWRETYTATTRSDGTVVEGYVDLIYREDDGSLVVIDYKTDAVPAGALSARAAYYQPQLHAYVDMLRAATGVDDIRPVLLFLHPERRGQRSRRRHVATRALRMALPSTVYRMATLTIRTDSEVEDALESLTQDGSSRSEAARAAILMAERAQRRARLRVEAEELRNDAEDVAASRALAAEMAAVRAW